MKPLDETAQDIAVPAPCAQRGRGALSNADNRFDAHTHEAWDDGWGTLEEALPPRRTTVHVDAARSVINRNDSPDIPFEQSINPYRGCEHGCIYCYARPTHAYLGLSPGLDFETEIFVKRDAAQLLEAELRRPGYRVSPIAFGANTDPYQPLERKLKVTRSLIEVLARAQHPLTIVTKSALIERDLDLLAPLAAANLVQVFVSVTTLDRSLARTLEPRAAAPQRRIETIRTLSARGVPVGVLTAPVIPALNDAGMEKILAAAHGAGARWAGYVLLRLPHEVKDLFQEWLSAHAPLKAAHVMSLIRQSRGSRDNDPTFGRRMCGQGEYAALIARRFRLACERLGLNVEDRALDTARFVAPSDRGDQLALFGSA
jgi:DNA repair photolyase